MLDTAQDGSADWYLSTFKDDNTVVCTDTYCTMTCVVYRELITSDKSRDVQYSKASSFDAVAGF